MPQQLVWSWSSEEAQCWVTQHDEQSSGQHCSISLQTVGNGRETWKAWLGTPGSHQAPQKKIKCKMNDGFLCVKRKLRSDLLWTPCHSVTSHRGNISIQQLPPSFSSSYSEWGCGGWAWGRLPVSPFMKTHRSEIADHHQINILIIYGLSDTPATDFTDIISSVRNSTDYWLFFDY